MKTYFQVCARYALQKGIPQLVGLSLHSTSDFFPFIIFTNSPFVYSRFFKSVQEAENFINYLFTHYPNSTAPRPVLDANQNNLF